MIYGRLHCLLLIESIKIKHVYRQLALFLATSFFVSCSTQKAFLKPSYTGLSEKKFSKAIEAKYTTNVTSFEVSKFTANLKSSNESKSFKGFIRSIPDSLLMVSISPALGIEMARFLFDTDTVSFIDRYNKSYFKNTYKYFNGRFGVGVNQNIIESFFMARLPHSITEDFKKGKFSENDTFYTIEYLSNNSASKQTLLYTFDKHLVLKRILLSSNSDVSYLTVDFKTYFADKGMEHIPQNIVITRFTSNSMDVLELEYKNVNLNKALNFPFSISNKYIKMNSL